MSSFAPRSTHQVGSVLLILALFAPLALSQEVSTQHSLSDEEIENLQKDIAGIRAGQMQLRRDIRRLEDLLRQVVEGIKEGNIELAPAEPAVDVRLTVSGERFLGQPDAPITLFEFSDYQ